VNLRTEQATPIQNGVAGFTFESAPNDALLTTTNPAQSSQLLGDLTGKTLSATVGVTITSGAPVFTYYGEPDPCGSPASVRIFFATNVGSPSASSSNFKETDYWWSNPSSEQLQALEAGDMTMSAALTGGNWSDYYGHFGNEPNYSAAFAAAVQSVTQVGVSFGGGCFFENGVGVSGGTADFRLMSFGAA
jgi:hypothetical protein